MNHLVIMRGLPGSGKSSLCDKIIEQSQGWVSVCSTDDYWFRPDGWYDFNGDRLGLAHKWNFSRFENSVAVDINLIVIDNTNIKWKDFKNYVRFAVEHGYTWEMVEATTEWRYDVDTLFKKNTHRVPLDAIQKMFDNWQPTENILNIVSVNFLKKHKKLIELGN